MHMKTCGRYIFLGKIVNPPRIATSTRVQDQMEFETSNVARWRVYVVLRLVIVVELDQGAIISVMPARHHEFKTVL